MDQLIQNCSQAQPNRNRHHFIVSPQLHKVAHSFRNGLFDFAGLGLAGRMREVAHIYYHHHLGDHCPT
jgi:hypothetical protein